MLSERCVTISPARREHVRDTYHSAQLAESSVRGAYYTAGGRPQIHGISMAGDDYVRFKSQ
jgi:hypothetical protein